jgi:transposase-like protein
MSIQSYYQRLKPTYNIPWSRRGQLLDRKIERCPYCQSRGVVRRGRRQTKYESVQLYLCKDCHKTFSPKILKNKQYPLKVIFDAISFYNLGHSKADTNRLLKEKYGLKVNSDTLTNWINELLPLCRYSRLRDQAKKHFSPPQIIQTAILNHQQVYCFRIHQAKLNYLLSQREFSHPRYHGLIDYFDSITNDYPHSLFQTDKRSSQTKINFDFNQVQIPRKENHATRLAQLVLQAVTDNRMRHEALQQFMLINDSVTVAMEVPIYLSREDLKHFTQKLKFNIPLKLESTLTGHIDILQIRNGLIHILDFKPNARKEKAYPQLMLYALALSRLTGLRLYDFKCAWFDENDYFEFFPLHLVHKR